MMKVRKNQTEMGKWSFVEMRVVNVVILKKQSLRSSVGVVR